MSENLLQFESSPYLLQHRDNPVHWRAWNPAALAEAKARDVPILLSIGYAACHWCHVMAHESFEDADTAAVMNALFVNIKVDREERPDIDQVYMSALHALGEQGGWPLTMFLTPDAKPIWGGTYFPKSSRFGRPAFVDILNQIAGLYREDGDALIDQAERITAHIATRRPNTEPSAEVTLPPGILDDAADTLLNLMDPVRGGTRGAPKFPNAPLLEFLAASAERTGRTDLADIVGITLQGLCSGGIFDHFGGGFARYSTDDRWLAPHFEKMLSDNGLLLSLLAYQGGPAQSGPAQSIFRRRIKATIDWLIRDMRLPDGGLAASLDADSEGHEGRYYVWTPAQVHDVLGVVDGDRLAFAYGITGSGNWDGVSIPNRLHDPSNDDEERRLRPLIDRMLAHRATRIPPERDDKLLTDWNAFAISGLAKAGLYLDRPDWTGLAASAYQAVVTSGAVKGRLSHAFRAGKRIHPGFSADLAAMAEAAIALHQATQDRTYLSEAARFLGDLHDHHGDGNGGFFLTADDGEALIIKKADRSDDAAPNAHGLAAAALVKLWALTGDDGLRERADRIINAAASDIANNVFGTASLLAAFDLRLRIETLVIMTAPGHSADALRAEALRHPRRNLLIDIRSDAAPVAPRHPAHGKMAIDGRATAYLCREGQCSLPVTEPADLRQLLKLPAATR